MTNPIAAVPKAGGGLFSNMPVRMKIMTGFGVVLGLSVVAGATSFFALSSIDTASTRYVRAGDIEQHVAEAGTELTEARRGVWKFVSTGDVADADAVRAAAGRFRDQLDYAARLVDAEG